MSYLIVLPHIQVENANAISGLTYGFPAITHFLGFTHALSRQIQQSHGLRFTGCGVVSHQHQIQAYQANDRGDHYFAQTRNPLTKEAKTAPFNEEGRMHMTVTLFIECEGSLAHGDAGARDLEKLLQSLCVTQRLAGGTVISMKPVRVRALPQNTDELADVTRREMYRALPGFALIDRSELLVQHFAERQAQDPQTEMIDAWLDFATISYRAIQPEGGTVEWQYQPKPVKGYLVPLMVGFTPISPLYAAGEVARTRDTTSPFRFVEATYGVGEWRSPHRVNDIHQLIWRYPSNPGNYLCSHTIPLQEADLTEQEHSDF
ncbi:type I-F CRISPR-associated protein Csy2 [Rahnella woolbedingensis]|uniref:Type I-F CRISPR-associated protein Csy2 n=1 Tax=Rahnella woolbedingensis TaxID=1510574 RepID=A0A419NE81_9GAMM|nr:type I-F CRISPR-associated protein Csy2 [Rahnella woolbedingensis]RJT47046.1 type I-F CRISPR-associated protein Csy2 [Rahnella woolbedingensis]